MESIKNILKIGNGPSSSHTMGPVYASSIFLKRNINATSFKVELYGSLAMTGKGHLTDKSILSVLGDYRTTVEFHPEICYEYHQNGMKFYAYVDNKEVDSWLVFSVGGGLLKELNEPRDKSPKEVYPHNSMGEILTYITKNKMTLVDYVKAFEEDDIMDYLEVIFNTMEETILRGIKNTVTLPGSLHLERKAKNLYQKYIETKDFNTLLYALTLAVSEENASGGKLVTAPTCGSAGVLPGVIFTEYYYNKVSKEKLIEAIAIAGLICDIVKTNASISGAEVGCQGEVGVACSAASAALTYIKGGPASFIEYASEIALEHHLGMTCDPIDGLVQIPCIERNAMAASFAYAATSYALLSTSDHYVSLDSIIEVMAETGRDIHAKYKETSTGGLALRAKKTNEKVSC